MAEIFTTSCSSCGSTVRYLPGTTVLHCETCGAERHIDDVEQAVERHALGGARSAGDLTPVAELGAMELSCRSCGALTLTDELSTSCQFCGGTLVVVESPDGVVPPGAVVPFGIDAAQATDAFRTWVSSQELAPDAVREIRDAGTLTGTYLPLWKIDLEVEVSYRGAKRDPSSGNAWIERSGVLRRRFNAVEVPASKAIGRLLRQDMAGQMSAEARAEADQSGGFDFLGDFVWASLGPWDVGQARPFQPEYLVGYSTLRYDIDPQEAIDKALDGLGPTLREAVHDDLGVEYKQAEGFDLETLQAIDTMKAFYSGSDRMGLEEFRGQYQRIENLDMTITTADVTQVLLPVWIGGYDHDGERFPIHVNARTGEVEGPRTVDGLKLAKLMVPRIGQDTAGWYAVMAGFAVVAVVMIVVLIL